MYTKRIQLVNYGPLERLDIEFPFEGETPKPVVLVGENGSGKSILLSHIVNGLIAAKGVAFPESSEVELDKVYKLRSSSYIRPESEYYFGRVDFEGSFFASELRTRRNKKDYPDVPAGIPSTAVHAIWDKLEPERNDHYDSNLIRDPSTKKKVEEIFAKNCVLYFPFNRFEEPAWLNEENLKARAQYMDLRRLTGQTSRKVIASSPLHDNQDWLFELAYDRAVLELQTQSFRLPVNDGSKTIPLPLFLGYSGHAAKTYDAALDIVRAIARRADVRFGIARRHNRVVSIMSEVGLEARQLVPNIFQLSSGETSLLNLFLSILRDFDLSGSTFSSAADIRGIVVVDEIDLHLHAVHQHEVLPELIQMFPKVQFVVTTHSPLFVLGMQRALGEGGFALYRLPQGQQISPEEFSEFGEAYRAFAATRAFKEDVRAVIEESQRPIVFVEGTTDQRYIERASRLLGREATFDGLELRDGGGKGNLAKMWKDSLLTLTEVLPQPVLLLFDCDSERPHGNKGKLLQRSIPYQERHPIEKGIENLFSRSTLERARQHNPAFFSTEDEHGGTNEVGNPITIPEKWAVNTSEKANLCHWLCENGTAEDFRHFRVIFELAEELVASTGSTIEATGPTPP